MHQHIGFFEGLLLGALWSTWGLVESGLHRQRCLSEEVSIWSVGLADTAVVYNQTDTRSCGNHLDADFPTSNFWCTRCARNGYLHFSPFAQLLSQQIYPALSFLRPTCSRERQLVKSSITGALHMSRISGLMMRYSSDSHWDGTGDVGWLGGYVFEVLRMSSISRVKRCFVCLTSEKVFCLGEVIQVDSFLDIFLLWFSANYLTSEMPMPLEDGGFRRVRILSRIRQFQCELGCVLVGVAHSWGLLEVLP